MANLDRNIAKIRARMDKMLGTSRDRYHATVQRITEYSSVQHSYLEAIIKNVK